MDPPLHRDFRRVLAKWLAPARIERCNSLGEFDVVDDLGNPLTAIITHEQGYIDRSSPELERIHADLIRGREHTQEFVQHRRESPADDLIVADRRTRPARDRDRGVRAVLLAVDERRPYDAADEIQLGRSPNRHLGWGDGVHRCVGTRLARTEMRIFYEELLERMPNFAVRSAGTVEFPSVGVTAGFVEMPAAADATA